MSEIRLEWNGDEVYRKVVNALEGALTEFGLVHEGGAKRALKPGRGVLTGTLRRSIHAASPDYNFASDDVKPGPGTPERGGTGGGAKTDGNIIRIVVGSGLHYARPVEERYGMIAGSHNAAVQRLPGIITKHAKRSGLL